MISHAVEILLFIASTGVYFNERFRQNRLAVGLAGIIALLSVYYLGKAILDDLGYLRHSKEQSRTNQQEPTTPAPLPAPSTHSSPFPPIEKTKPPTPVEADEIFWLTIRDSAAPGLFEEFIRRFPSSPHLGEARARLALIKSTPPIPPIAAPVPQLPSQPAILCENVFGMTLGDEEKVARAQTSASRCFAEGRIGVGCQNLQSAISATRSSSTQRVLSSLYERNCIIR